MVEIEKGTGLFKSSKKNPTDMTGRDDTDKENSSVEIYEGFGNKGEEIVERSRKRFRLSALSSKEKPRWRRFYEAVILDYIQKGPDQPAPDGEAGRRRTDDRDMIKLIKKRFLQMFCLPFDPKESTSEQVEAVSSALRCD
jgi:hypothetical protein